VNISSETVEYTSTVPSSIYDYVKMFLIHPMHKTTIVIGLMTIWTWKVSVNMQMRTITQLVVQKMTSDRVRSYPLFTSKKNTKVIGSTARGAGQVKEFVTVCVDVVVRTIRIPIPYPHLYAQNSHSCISILPRSLTWRIFVVVLL
jgi:hypothetical protein